MPVRIHMADKRDAGLIADLSRQTFYESFIDQNSPENMEKFLTEQFTREKLIEEVGAKGNIFFLAYQGDEVVGYVRLRENNRPPELIEYESIEIARIYVAKPAIGKGVGRILMQKCIDIATQLKKDVLWLGVWEHNHRAIEFYKKWGFVKFGTHVFLLGDDPQTDWLMYRKQSL